MFDWIRKAKDRGIYLGHFLDENGRLHGPVHYPHTIHGCIIGPNGAGKGTGLIINHLAALRRSVFVIDPKGEAAAITARSRAQLGPVVIINPF